MIALRRKSAARAGIVSALTLLTLCAALLALAGAASAAPSEDDPPPPVPQLSFDPGSYDFGLQQVNNGSEASLQVRNDGEAMAPIYSLEIQGAGVFWINGGATSCYGRNLEPGESCWVQVGFNPYEATSFTAQLRVGSENGAAFSAELSGEGGRAMLGPVAEPTNFGVATVGSAGVTRAVEVTNSGNFPGGAFIAVIAGGAIGSFHLLDENCTGVLLGPGASCTLLVNFQPLSSGVKTARLGLFGDQEGGGQVTLTGIGVEATTSPASKPASDSFASPEARQKRRGKHRRRKSSHRNGHLRAAVSAHRPSY